MRFGRRDGDAEIIVNRQHDDDVYIALRDAFDSAKRQFEEAIREQRGDVKTKVPELPAAKTSTAPSGS